MFKFFTTRKWLLWAWGGTTAIFGLLYFTVQVDVMINTWFGEFYDMIQKALSAPNSITMTEYFASLFKFGWLAGMWITAGLIASFITSHFLFRWRTSMVEWYHSVYHEARHIEGASQRVQEDTVKFTKLLEDLGTSLIESVMILVEFLPILIGLSLGLHIMWFADWEYGLLAAALIWAIGGTLLLAGLAWVLRLVGIEYDLQKKEARYRKMLVIAEDDGSIRPKSFADLYDEVRQINYLSYFRYLFFNIGKYSYLQANVLVAYVLLAPAIVAGTITLGVMQQIVRAFGRVEGSMQYLYKAWPKIIELLSVYKRLREFEATIKQNAKNDVAGIYHPFVRGAEPVLSPNKDI